MLLANVVPGPCRTAQIAACEVDAPPSQNDPILAVGTFYLHLRDSLDFSVDLSKWLAANGGAQLTGAAWAVAADSPKTPVLTGVAFSPQGKSSVVVTPGAEAVAGDAYWLDVTLTIGATVSVNVGDVALPARTMVRRIHIVIVKG